MKIIHPELLQQTLASQGASVKFLLGDSVVVFFPVALQHLFQGWRSLRELIPGYLL